MLLSSLAFAETPIGIATPAQPSARDAVVGKRLWQALLLLVLVDAVWLAALPLAISDGSWAILIRLIPLALLGAWASARLISWPRLRLLCEGGVFMLLAWPALRLLNHLVMTMAFPLVDAELAAIDRTLGFDWLSYLSWLDHIPLLLSIMGLLYTSLSIYVGIFLVVVAAVSRQPLKSCKEFVELFFLAAVVFCLVGSFFPALSAAVHYGPLPVFDNIDPQVGAYHLGHLKALRNDPNHILNLAEMPGLVTFPSFHTAMGIIAIYCCRSIGTLLIASLIVNGLMIASTPLFGAHYLIDIIGGMAVSVVLIVLHARWSDKQPPTPVLDAVIPASTSARLASQA